MCSTTQVKSKYRESVMASYNYSACANGVLWVEGDIRATAEYTFDNQKEDAAKIVHLFYRTAVQEGPTLRAISIVKPTKVGMDGTMIEIAKSITTHPDDDFVIPPGNVFFITGMSNVAWERNFKEKMPEVFRANIHHHGKLQQIKKKLHNIRDAIIVIDEIDCGDKEGQKMHTFLRESGVLDMKYMDDNNIRFVFVSATMPDQLNELERWGKRHYCFKMQVPENYIGHREFLARGIIQEYYPVNNDQSARRWLQEDILDFYGDEYRVHLIRTDEKNKKYIYGACRELGITCLNHTSDDRITQEKMTRMFERGLDKHVVIMVKGLLRRANLIPNPWKMKIGAMHERYSKTYNTSVAAQGFPGRMSGYWKSVIDCGHKTGPYRTSIAAMHEYIAFLDNPDEKNPYMRPPAKPFVNVKNIKNLEAVNAPVEPRERNTIRFREFNTFEEVREFYNTVLKSYYKSKGFEKVRGPQGPKENSKIDGFYHISLRNNDKKVWSYENIRNETVGFHGERLFRLRPCYRDTTDPSSLVFVFAYKELN